METIGARPWQILIHEDRPEPLPIYKTPIDIVIHRNPQWEFTEIFFNLPQGETSIPSPLLKIAAGIALDMAKDIPLEYLARNIDDINVPFDYNHRTISNVIDELVEYYSAYPYVRDERIIDRALSFFRRAPFRFNHPLLLYHAAYSLPDNRPWNTISDCMMTLAAAWIRNPIIRRNQRIEIVGSRRYYLYHSDWTEANEEQLIDNLNYWIGVWWQEVLDTLAFVGPSSWKKYAK